MYSFDGRVRYSECDEDGRLSLLGLVNYLQDCSTFQSQSLGIGLDFMAAHHFAWFISAWQIEIDELPRFFDPIVVSTWAYSMRRTQAGRCFTISSPEGRTYVQADSLWFVYDTEAKSPVRIPESQLAYAEDTPRLDLPPTKRKLEVEGPYREARPVTIAEQHLDTNRHVNNAQYIQLACDALEELGEAFEPRRICVQYRQMALLGDLVAPRVHRWQDGACVDLSDGGERSYAVVRLSR